MSSGSVEKAAKPQEKLNLSEPVNAAAEHSYAFDGEEQSPMSAGMKRMLTEQNVGDEVVGSRDRAMNVLAVLLLFAIAITAVVSIAAGACCLASLSGKAFHHFPMFFAFGVAPVVIGCACLVLVLVVIVFISFCAMGLRQYGMCCYGATRGRACMRVCLLGVFPFIVLIVLLAMSILGFTFFSLSQQVPPLNKNYDKVSGITGVVEIVRDDNGLVHIKANSRRDAIFGQGFAAAQDRLFQLEFHRLVAKGQLGKYVGKDGAATDTSIRTLNVRKAGEALCALTDDETHDYLEAFAEGINEYMRRVSKRPVEFFFMGSRALFFHDPEPFSAVDMCLTARLFQWQLAANVSPEGKRFSIWAGTNRTYEEVESLFPDFTDQPNTIMSVEQMQELMGLNTTNLTAADSALAANAKNDLVSAKTEANIYNQLLTMIRATLGSKAASSLSEASSPAALQAQVQESVTHIMQDHFYRLADDNVFAFKYLDASNAWAARDAAGHTMVASDPHLTINLPSIWYYVHMSFPAADGTQFDAAGVCMLGVPGVHIGRTTHVAWGITMSKTDLEDLFIFPPTSYSGLPANTYMYAGKLRSFVPRRERIEVRGGKDIVLDVKDTLLGPIVTTMLGFPSSLQVALYAIPLLTDDNTSMRALLDMSSPSRDTAEKLMNTILNLQAPGFSIPIADVHGNLAYGVTGRHPLRPSGHTGKYPTCAFPAVAILNAIGSYMASNNLTATPGLSTLLPIMREQLQRSTWSTYVSAVEGVEDARVPTNANPHVHIPFDSKEAHISAANQKILPKGYPYFFGADYSWPYRGARVQELLDENLDTLSSSATHLRIQMDHRSNLWTTDYRPVVSGADFQAAIAGDVNAVYWSNRLLNEWDTTAEIGSVETAFFWRWLQRMAVLPADVLKATKAEHWAPENRYLITMLTAPTSRMLAECAVYLGAPQTSTSCFEVAVKTFKEQSSDRTFGERWGLELHRLYSVHEMLEKKIIHPVFQREMAKAGDVSSVAVSGNTIDGRMLSKHASSMRMVYDLWNQTDRVYFALPGGASGNPYSKFYDNMWHKFEAEEYVSVIVAHGSWDKISKSSSQELSP